MKVRFYGPLLLTCLLFLLVLSEGGQKSSDKPTKQRDRAMLMQKDYEALTGRWQLVKAVVDGKPMPEDEVRKTILITDHNIFRFPANANVGTAAQGEFHD